MKNIFILPANGESRLCYVVGVEKSTLTLFEDEMGKSSRFFPQHIYITNNEDIKEGFNQWYIDGFLNKPRNSSGSQYGEKQDVVLLTDDPKLIADGVQSLDDDFLNWFLNNQSCEYVEVKKGKMRLNCDGEEIGFPDMSLYKTIIPKEETKQEWLKNSKWGVRLNKDKQPDFTYIDEWFEGNLFKRNMLQLVYPDSPSFSNKLWKVFETEQLAKEWIKNPIIEKKETLEESAERILANNIDGLRDAIGDDDLFLFYKGVVKCYGEAMAKWQQEQVIKLLKENDYANEVVFEFLTEQFKKYNNG